MPDVNPIFPKWHDPFVGSTEEFITDYGKGDLKREYNLILDEAIADWNKCVDNGEDLPRTSKECGMERIPVFGGDAAHRRNREAFERRQREGQ